LPWSSGNWNAPGLLTGPITWIWSTNRARCMHLSRRWCI